jgi:hypothetical protein
MTMRASFFLNEMEESDSPTAIILINIKLDRVLSTASHGSLTLQETSPASAPMIGNYLKTIKSLGYTWKFGTNIKGCHKS